MKTIKSLLSEYCGDRIYVYLHNERIAKLFMKNAEEEGFTFEDGVKPTERGCSNIIAINEDMTINYVGFVGHMAYQCADKIGDKKLIRIDYRDLLKEN